jgi:hypothetical protein
MKQFNSLTEGFAYQSKCPICNSELDIGDDKHQALILEIPIYHNNEQVLICYELIDGDLIIIDKYTAEINFIIRNNLNFNYHTNSFPISLECSNRDKNRCLFSYQILCRIDSEKNELYDFCLLSEQLSIENNKKELCVIKNDYQQNITCYTQDIFSFPNLDGKRKQLPLIDLDFKNISAFLNKIESYLIFS